jgi:hypothetical protein
MFDFRAQVECGTVQTVTYGLGVMTTSDSAETATSVAQLAIDQIPQAELDVTPFQQHWHSFITIDGVQYDPMFDDEGMVIRLLRTSDGEVLTLPS